MAAPPVGQLICLKVYSGVLETGSYLYNSKKTERTDRAAFEDARRSA